MVVCECFRCLFIGSWQFVFVFLMLSNWNDIWQDDVVFYVCVVFSVYFYQVFGDFGLQIDEFVVVIEFVVIMWMFEWDFKFWFKCCYCVGFEWNNLVGQQNGFIYVIGDQDDCFFFLFVDGGKFVLKFGLGQSVQC